MEEGSEDFVPQKEILRGHKEGPQSLRYQVPLCGTSWSGVGKKVQVIDGKPSGVFCLFDF